MNMQTRPCCPAALVWLWCLWHMNWWMKCYLIWSGFITKFISYLYLFNHLPDVFAGDESLHEETIEQEISGHLPSRLWAGFYAVSPYAVSSVSQFFQQCILLFAHTFIHNPFIFCVCGFTVRFPWLPGCARDAKKANRLSDISIFVFGGELVRPCQLTSVSLCPLTQVMAWAKSMWQLFLSNGHKCVHIAGADGQDLYPASCPAHFSPSWCAMPIIPLHWKERRRRWWGGLAVWLREGKATVPIFHPVNKLQKQMDLGAEIYLAPLKWLKPSFADLF